MSGEAVYLVDVAAGDAEGGVAAADGFFGSRCRWRTSITGRPAWIWLVASLVVTAKAETVATGVVSMG
jgi:hypothetical protein